MKEAFVFYGVIMRPIPGWPDYFADEEGNIYSQKVRWYGDAVTAPRKLNPFYSSNYGYKIVGLTKNNRQYQQRVSALVLETFVGPRPKGMWACHGTKGHLVNTLDNLYWGTPKQNALDKIRDGTQQIGEKSSNHKLNELQIRIIRRSYSRNGVNVLLLRQLAEVFDVAPAHIHSIVSRKCWKHIP